MEVRRECHFNSLEDFVDKMNLKRQALKHAVSLYAKNRGQSWSEIAVQSGPPGCERKTLAMEQVTYDNLLDGSSFELTFDLLSPIGDKITTDDTMYIQFIRASDNSDSGRWKVNGEVSIAAGQVGKKVSITENKVYVMGARFTFENDEEGNYLVWTKSDCEYNAKRFSNLQDSICTFNDGSLEEEDGDIDWIDVPLATVSSLNPPTEFLPCMMEWSNHQIIMSDKSCIKFIAASDGPIYFGLSSVPDKLSTWYYFRITSVSISSSSSLFHYELQEEVTLYKGNQLLDSSTNASEAVGLGIKDLFQTYIVCSENEPTTYDGVETISTKLSYGKIVKGEE